MNVTFLVKHAVGGRTFIDTGKRLVDYRMEQAGEGWRFIVDVPLDSSIEELLRWKDELNVFLFYAYDDQPTKKVWYYVQEGPVTYDAQKKQLTIEAQSRIEYVPDSFGAPA